MTKFAISNFKNLRNNSMFLTIRCLPITEERAIFSFITKRNDTLKLCKLDRFQIPTLRGRIPPLTLRYILWTDGFIILFE